MNDPNHYFFERFSLLKYLSESRVFFKQLHYANFIKVCCEACQNDTWLSVAAIAVFSGSNRFMNSEKRPQASQLFSQRINLLHRVKRGILSENPL